MDTRKFIENFIEDMVKDASFGKMPAQMKKIYAKKMETSFMRRMGTEIMALFSDEDLKEFKEMIEKNPDWTNEEIFGFCQKRINLPEVLGKVMADFRKEYLEAAKDLESKVKS
jgi:uncharacterized protein (DUF1697 family)